jgi:two-component system cell cycle sensor histidine kinase/response regulator CckA
MLSINRPENDAAEDPNSIIQMLCAVADSAGDILFVKDLHGKYVFCNATGRQQLERSSGPIVGSNDLQLFGQAAQSIIREQDLRVIRTGVAETEDHVLTLDDIVHTYQVTKSPWRHSDRTIAGVIGVARDVTQRRQTLKDSQRLHEILRKIACDTPLVEVLDELTHFVDDSFPGVVSSFLLPGPDGKRLWVASAPGLPQSYRDAIDGIEIGPEAGSCGTAMWRRRRVEVSDVFTDPLWVDFRQLAAEHGICACHSEPILSQTEGSPPLGVFAVYFRVPGFPDERMNSLIDRIRDLAFIAVEAHRKTQELRDSEHRFRTFIENTTDSLFLLGDHGTVIDVNDQACQHLGYSRQELIGMSPMDFDPDASPEQLASLTARLEQGEKVTFETRHRRSDGTILPVEVRLKRFLHMNAPRDLAVVHDISERQRARVGLLREQQLLRETQAIAHLGSFDWDMITNQLTWSDELFRIYGYEPQEISVDLNVFFSHLLPEDVPMVQATIQRACEERGHFRMQERIRRKDGMIRVLESQGRVVSDDSGRNVRMPGACLDITERVQAEEALRISEERTRSLIAALAEGVVFQTADSMILECNHNAERILGLSADQICGRTSLDPEWRAILEDGTPFPGTDHPSMVSLRTGKPTENVVMGVHKPDGTLTWISINAEPLFRPEAEEPYGVVCSFSDITRRKISEDALRESEQRLRIALGAAGAVAFFWDVSTDCVTRYFSSEPALPVNSGVSETLADVMARVHEDDQVAFQNTIQGTLKAGTDYENLYRVKRPDGSFRWLQEWGVLERDVTGAPRKLMEVSIDVTERRQNEVQLQQTVSRLQATLESTADGILVVDLSGRILDFNQQFLNIWEISPELIRVGRKEDLVAAFNTSESSRQIVGQLVDPDAFVSRVQQIYQQPDESTFDVLTFLNGRIVERYSRPQRVAGVPVGRVWSFRDVTERRKAEKELRETSDLLRAVVTGTTDAVFVKDINGRYLMFNEAACQFVGKPVVEVLGRDDTELFDVRSAAFVMERDRRIMETGDIETKEETLTAAGATRTYLATKGPYRDASGKVIGVLGISRDITDRKRAEEERDRLWNYAPDPLCIATFDGKLSQVNPAWSRILGWHESELLGRPWLDFVHPDDHRATLEAREQLLQGNSVIGFENRYRCRNGQFRWFSWNSIPLSASRRILGFIRDVTTEKQIAEQFRQAQKMEAVGRLAGGIAHDFNNLLTVINGHAELLLAAMLPRDPQREPLISIRDAGERAAALTSQLLSLSRKAIVEPKVIDLNEVVESTARLLRRLIGTHIQLSVIPCPGSAPVKADPSQMEQVVMNLVVNARDAMPSGGQLTIQTNRVTITQQDSPHPIQLVPGNYICLNVQDTGQGMTSDVKNKIFEPFFTTKAIGKGTGLGLAVVHGVIAQCGGQILVETLPDSGTTFSLYIPMSEENLHAESAAPGRSSGHGTETVLLVEDDESVRRITRIALESQGFSVIEASSGPDALQLISRITGPIDLVITDVVMPEMGGRQLVECIREQRPDQRVLYMSGHTFDTMIHRGTVVSGDAFLQKPFTALGLVRKVRSILDSR